MTRPCGSPSAISPSDPELPRAIVVRSTLLPGTAVDIAREVRTVDASVRIAHNPEVHARGGRRLRLPVPGRIAIGVDGHDDGAAGSGTRGRPCGASTRHFRQRFWSPTRPARADRSRPPPTKSLRRPTPPSPTKLCGWRRPPARAAQAVVDGMGLDRRIGRSFLSARARLRRVLVFPSQARALPRLARGYARADPADGRHLAVQPPPGRLAHRAPGASRWTPGGRDAGRSAWGRRSRPARARPAGVAGHPAGPRPAGPGCPRGRLRPGGTGAGLSALRRAGAAEAAPGSAAGCRCQSRGRWDARACRQHHARARPPAPPTPSAGPTRSSWPTERPEFETLDRPSRAFDVGRPRRRRPPHRARAWRPRRPAGASWPGVWKRPARCAAYGPI